MKRIIIISYSLMFFLAFSAPALIETYVDNFGDGDFDGWEIRSFRGDDSEWTVRNRTLMARCPSLWSSVLSIGEQKWHNYSIELDAKMVEIIDGSFNAIGFGLRVQDGLNTVWCAIGKGADREAWIQVWNGGVVQISWNRDFMFRKNQWYHLKGVANENDFEFYVDGELLATLSSSRFPTGRIDLHASGCVAYFDNVEITGDDISEDGNLAVSSPGKLVASWGQVKKE